MFNPSDKVVCIDDKGQNTSLHMVIGEPVREGSVYCVRDMYRTGSGRMGVRIVGRTVMFLGCGGWESAFKTHRFRKVHKAHSVQVASNPEHVSY